MVYVCYGCEQLENFDRSQFLYKCDLAVHKISRAIAWMCLDDANTFSLIMGTFTKIINLKHHIKVHRIQVAAAQI